MKVSPQTAAGKKALKDAQEFLARFQKPSATQGAPIKGDWLDQQLNSVVGADLQKLKRLGQLLAPPTTPAFLTEVERPSIGLKILDGALNGVNIAARKMRPLLKGFIH